jgi:Uma2 family endonuclease
MQQTITPPLTYDDLVNTPDDGRRYEIIDGEMIVSASPSRKHQHASTRIHRLLNDASDDERHGVVFSAPVDVRLSPHDIVEPDLLFIRRERLHIYTDIGIVEGPPDIVVEILSPSSHSRDLVRKAKLYAWGEVPEYWQVDPIARTLTVLALIDGHYQQVPAENGIQRSLVLPNLRIDVAALFEGL